MLEDETIRLNIVTSLLWSRLTIYTRRFDTDRALRSMLKPL